ncbi:MAG: HD-GYP domain-containing protein, partial [Vicinamibacterales bacterium]
DEAILQLAKDIVYTHHERWDGTGYPRGLRGEEIPVAGRIMALVDVYDALVEPRPYRRRMPHEEAVALIVGGSGSQFDPDVVRAFLTVAGDFQELGTRLRESAQSPAM